MDCIPSRKILEKKEVFRHPLASCGLSPSAQGAGGGPEAAEARSIREPIMQSTTVDSEQRRGRQSSMAGIARAGIERPSRRSLAPRRRGRRGRAAPAAWESLNAHRFDRRPSEPCEARRGRRRFPEMPSPRRGPWPARAGLPARVHNGGPHEDDNASRQGRGEDRRERRKRAPVPGPRRPTPLLGRREPSRSS